MSVPRKKKEDKERRKMAEKAAEQLLEQVRSEPVEQKSAKIDAELRIRESTGPV